MHYIKTIPKLVMAPAGKYCLESKRDRYKIRYLLLYHDSSILLFI